MAKTLDHFINGSVSPSMKRCTECELRKPVTKFRKGRNKCKECTNKHWKEYYERNKEKINKRKRKYREENKEKMNERGRKYYAENKEKMNERGKKKQKENKKKAGAIHGGKCQNEECPYPDINTNSNYLEFHHKYGQRGGGKKEINSQVYLRIIKYGIQDDIELYCAPCHKRADIRDETYLPQKFKRRR